MTADIRDPRVNASIDRRMKDWEFLYVSDSGELVYRFDLVHVGEVGEVGEVIARVSLSGGES